MITDKDVYWSRLLTNIAEGRPGDVAALERMDTLDFYHFYSAWSARQQAIIDSYKQT